MANKVRDKITDTRNKVPDKPTEAPPVPGVVRGDVQTGQPIQAFTNRPELANTEATPGVRYNFVTNADQSATPSQMGNNQAYLGAGGNVEGPIKDVKAALPALDEINRLEGLYKQSQQVPQSPPSQTPQAPGATPSSGVPEDMQFTWQDRERFRNQVIQNQFNGKDPYTVSVPFAMQKITEQQAPAWFNEFTGGQVTWEDRGLLQPKEQEAWSKFYTAKRAHLQNNLKSEQAQAIRLMSNMMNRWDMKAKEATAERKAARQPPKTQYMENSKGELTMHQWNPDKRTWEDTGRKKMYHDVGGPTAGEKLKYANTESAISDSDHNQLPLSEPGSQITGSNLKYLNDQRKVLGMPELIEKKIPGKGTFSRDKYYYQEAGKSGSPYNEDQLSKIQQNPRTYLGSDGYYYINGPDGQPLRIVPKTPSK